MLPSMPMNQNNVSREARKKASDIGARYVLVTINHAVKIPFTRGEVVVNRRENMSVNKSVGWPRMSVNRAGKAVRRSVLRMPNATFQVCAK